MGQWRPIHVGSPAHRRSPLAHRRLQIVRALSCEVLQGGTGGGAANGGGSPAAASNSATMNLAIGASPPRAPAFAMPPPITIASPASFGSFGDSDDGGYADVLSGSAQHKAKVMRVRSFGSSSRLSSLGPARSGSAPGADATVVTAATAANAAVGGRPPPIRTVASLESISSPAPLATRSSSASNNAPPAGGKNSPAPSFFALPDISGEASPRAPGIAAPTPRRQRSRQSFAASLMARGGGRSGRSSPMSRVAPCLYVGDERAAADRATLRAAGVTHVLNCTAHPNSLENEADAPSYMQLGLMDSTADLPRMQGALLSGSNWIAEAIRGGGTVLVHCHRGISRSATIAMAYLVRATQQPVDAVFEQMRACRRCVDPNLGYMCALKEWEQRVLPPAVLRSRSSTGSPRPISRSRD